MIAATQSNTQTTIKSGYQSKSREVSDFTYECSEIPQDLIDECEKLSRENDGVYFIFDNSISDLINNRYLSNKVEKREIIIDQLINKNDKFHIGTEMYFREMPSRFSYYDTETKQTDRYKKYKILTDFLDTLGFISNREFNFGPEYDQSYTLSIEGKSFIARIKPNLFLSIQCGFINDHPNNIFDGFFSRSRIMESMKKESPNLIEVIRDIKLNTII